MWIDHQGKRYQMIRASDLERDGMSLELHTDGRAVAEIFYSDVSKDFSISLFIETLPLEVIERLIAEARVALLPMKESSDTRE